MRGFLVALRQEKHRLEMKTGGTGGLSGLAGGTGIKPEANRKLAPICGTEPTSGKISDDDPNRSIKYKY